MGTALGRIQSETPKYTRVLARDGFELRHYAANTAIETVDRNPERRGGGPPGAFMALAGYIGVRGSPQNTEAAPIAMTAPVVSMPNTQEGTMRMQFILPAAVGSTPPAPTNPDVSVQHRPDKVMAVTTFNGDITAALFATKRAELLAALERDAQHLWGQGFAVKKPVTYEEYRYNPPWTPGFLRTNEVAVEMERTAAG